MQYTDLGKFFSDNFAGSFSANTNNMFDMKTILETNRKNLQALTEAQQLAVTNIQAVAKKQAEIMSRIVATNANIAKEVMEEGTPEEKVIKQTEAAKKIYEASVTNLRELADLVARNNFEASDIINQRITASLTELKASIEKQSSRKKAA